MSIQLEFPEGYSWISNSKANYKVNSGKATYGGESIYITGTGTLDMNVRLRVVKPNKNTEKASPSEALYQ